MGIYSRTLQKYNLLKNFRVNNGTVWSYSRNLVFWLQATEADDNFVDRSRNVTAIAATGTGFTSTRQGPDARFQLKSLGFDNKYLTVSGGEAADTSDSKSLVFAGWIYLDVSPSLNNEGFCILQTDANEGWCIFIDDQGRLGIRLTNYADSTYDGGATTLASSTVKTSNSVVQSQKWVHFAIAIDKDVSTETIFRATSTKPTIMIDGTKKATTTTQVGSPGSLDPKTAAASYRVGYGPAKDETATKVYLDGALAELVLFQPEEDVTEAKLKALYQASINGANHLGSGFISTTPFNVLNDAMNRDTHPTVARSSNDGRLGNHTIHFDDSRAIHITNDGPTSFPSMLTEDNPLFSTVYNGIDNGQLTTTAASASFGILDEYYEESNSIAIPPFIDSKVYIDSGSIFYQTGTLESVIPGFNQSLKNKHQIQIVTDISSETVIGSTSDVEEENIDFSGDGVHWMKYVDFSKQKLVNIGHGIYPDPGVNVNSNSSTGRIEREAWHHKQTLAFSPVGGQFFMGFPREETSSLFNAVGAGVNTGQMTYDNQTDKLSFPLSGSVSWINNFGRPFDNFGFPGTENYKNPTSGCLISMSEYINREFLLEKISVRFKCKTKIVASDGLDVRQSGIQQSNSINYPGGKGKFLRNEDSESKYSMYAKMITAFLIRQSPSKKSVTFDTDFTVSTDSTPNIVQKVASGSFRDVIGYGQTSIMQELQSSGFEEDYYAIATDPTGSQVKVRLDLLREYGLDREQNIILDTATSLSNTEFDVNCNINFVPKNIFSSNYRGLIQVRSTAEGGSDKQQAMVLHYKRDRSSIYDDELLEERRLSAGVNGIVPDLKLRQVTFQSGQGTITGFDGKITVGTPPVNFEVLDAPTPYILKPEDNLMLGIQAPVDNQWSTSLDIDANYIKIQPGQIQLTLYGSFLQQEKPLRISNSQTLSTHTVHESIGEINPTDKFVLAQLVDFTGSFSDDIISGSINPKTIYEGYDHYTGDTIKLARRVGGRASQGTQGETGALKINNRLVDVSERDYDSLMPDFRQLSAVDDAFFGETQKSALENGVISFGTSTVASASNWLYSFPFESRYARINRTHAIVKPDGTRESRYKLEFRDATAGTSIMNYSDAGTLLTGSIGFAPRNSEDSLGGNNEGTINQNVPERDVIKMLFGIGDLSRGRFFAIGADNDGDRVGINSQNAGGTINLGGFKYGVSNSSAAYSSAVYRRDSFGQFRDLLEPRQFLTYIKDSSVSFPVSQRFLSRTGQPLGVQTRGNSTCSNLSTHASSSLPFFDRPNDSGPLNRDGQSTVAPVNISPNFAPALGPFTGLA